MGQEINLKEVYLTGKNKQFKCYNPRYYAIIAKNKERIEAHGRTLLIYADFQS